MDFKFKDTERLEIELEIKKLLKTVKRDGIDKLIKYLEDTDFFLAPASTVYHLACEGGLAFHSLSVYKTLKEKLEKNEIYGKYSDETIILVALLHDICKINFYKKQKRKKLENDEWIEYDSFTVDEKLPLGHGEKSVIVLQKFINLTMQEILAIRWHMGAFDSEINQKNYSKAIEICPLVLALHEADSESAHIVEVKYVEDNS